MNEQRYPLEWPPGWPRTKFDDRESDARFSGSTYGGLSVERTRNQLFQELNLLGASDVVLSTNLALRRDGMPIAEVRRLEDPGVAAYFTLSKRRLVMATDRFVSVAGNMRSIALAIAGMRQLQRHGGGPMMDRAMSGFVALPAPGARRHWRVVLAIPSGQRIDRDAIELQFRMLAKVHHPDRGGSTETMAELTAARAEALKEIAS